MIKKLVKLWRLLNYLEIQEEKGKVTFLIKGVSISISNQDDLELIIPNSYIQHSKYSFTNCEEDFISKVKAGIYEEEECLVLQD